MVSIKLKELAKKLNKNITDIALETGINRNTITALFHNKVEGIKFETVEKLCKQYGVGLGDLLELGQEPIADHKSISWYRQEGAISAFSIWPVLMAISEYKYLLKNKLYGFGEGYCFFQKNYGWLYWDTDTMTKLARAIYSEYAVNPSTANKYFEKYIRASVDLENAYRHDKPQLVMEIGDRELLEHLVYVNRCYRKFWEQSLFIDAFDPELDQEIISRAAKTHNLTVEEIAVLATPTRMTFANERLYSLLKIAKKIIGSIKGKPNSPIIRKKIQENYKIISEYILDFDYYKSNYSNTYHITPEEIFTEISDYVKHPLKLKSELDKLVKYEKNQEVAVNKILKKHHLKENPLFFISLLTYWREHRKKLNLMGFHVLDSILAAIENRTGIAKKDLRLMTFDEVGGVLKGTISAAMLKERHDEGVLIHLYENNYRLIHGNEAKSIRADLDRSSAGTDDTITEIKGQTACQGYARGPACIVLDHNDFHKFKQGEILITGMTRPEFVPLMKIAAGIVTNEGGITCHAAIVSRELGKPCIIGTKNATEVIKDGDIVEVRANHGTVKIVRS